MSVEKLTKSFDNMGKVLGIGAMIVDDLVRVMNEAVSSEFTVGQRIQFYRKGLSEDGKEITLAINGRITRIAKNGWLTVEHRWGWATVKPDEEKLQVLQQKASKNQVLAEAYGGAEVISGTMVGSGPNPQNIARV